MTVSNVSLDRDIEKQSTNRHFLKCQAAVRYGTTPDQAGSDIFWSDQASSSAGSVQAAQQEPPIIGRTLRQRLCDLVTVYGCLFCIVVMANFAALLHTICKADVSDLRSSRGTVTPIAANVMLALLARNEHFVNALYHVACIGPRTAPFSIRAALSQVHNYGGLHSGCAVAAAMWHCLQTGLISLEFANRAGDAVSLTMSWVILLFLGTIVLSALPPVRVVMHDYFEVVHRFAGWVVVILVWVQLALATSLASQQSQRPVWAVLLTSTATWFWIMATVLVIYPWLRIRSRKVVAEKLSAHALRLHFEGRAGPCTAVKLSDHPLRDNHPFACIPQRGAQNTFSVIVSRAGDWTSELIHEPPTTLWMRETPQRGVLWVARMFSPVVIVATGSGIGPCLGLFNGCQDLPCRVLWSARQPVATYGEALIESVRQADPNAVIIDTDQCGRPDLPREAEKLYKEAAAEAVVVISNQKLTYEIVTFLSRRGVCARGPIWDS